MATILLGSSRVTPTPQNTSQDIASPPTRHGRSLSPKASNPPEKSALSRLPQSLFFVWFFRLTHTFGSVGPALGLVPTVIFFALQIWFSVWWLRRFQFGPAEWAWRPLTYGVAQPMRRSDQHFLYHVAGNVG